MELVRLEPIRIGFQYEVAIWWPESYLQPGDTIRGELRYTANQVAVVATFTSLRDGDVTVLLLSETVTEDLTPAQAILDLVHTTAGEEYNVTSPRFVITIENSGTRAI